MKHSRKYWAAALIAATLTGFVPSWLSADPITITSDTTYDSTTQENASWVVTNGATLTYNDTAPRATADLSIVLGDASVSGDTGNLVFNMTTVPGSTTHGAEYAMSNGKAASVTGSGTLTLKGGGNLAMISSEGGSVTFALSAGSQINLETGKWVNGGWGAQYWSDNKANMKIASDADLHLWDGNSIYVNELTGEGDVTTDKTNVRGGFFVGVNNGSSQFDGVISGSATLFKKGTGTLTLTKDNSNTGATDSASGDASMKELLKNSFVISEGTVKLTGAGSLGKGTTKIESGGTLEIAREIQIAKAITGDGDIKVSSGILYVNNNGLSKDLTVHLAGGQIRNYNESYSLDSNLVIDSTDGGLRPGWPSKSLTVNGKISNGTQNTLKIVSDSNTGDVASWIILTNPNNDYTNTTVDHYLRVTATGALGTGTVTVNSGKVLDLYGTELAASRLVNNGTVTSSNTETPAIMVLSGTAPGGTFSGNIKFQIATKTNIGILPSTHTGGTLVENMEANCITYGAGLGTGDITLNGGMLMNNSLTLGLFQNINVTSKNGSIRAGWVINRGSVGITGDISGEGKLTYNSGEGDPGPIYLAGDNTYSGGTSFGSTGGTNRMYINSNSAFGTGAIDINGKNVVLAFNTGGAWGRTLYNGSFNTTDSVSIAEYKLNMDDTANTNSSEAWKGTDGVANNKTFGYSTVIQADKTTTLEFGKHFDDNVAIFVTNLNTGEKSTIMNKAGDWTAKTFSEFTFEQGVPYQMDVRLGQGTGGVGVAIRKDGSNPDLNGLNDDPNDLVGVGVRVKDSGGKFVRLSIAANGDWAFSDGSIKTVAQNWELDNDLKLGASTLEIQNTGIGNATVSGKITGTGTLNFTNSSLLDSETNGLSIFNGSPNSDADTFNVAVGPNVRFTGNGTVPGSLTLDDTAILVIDESMGLGAMQIDGKLDASDSTIDVLLTGADSDFVFKASSIDLTNAAINVSYTGDVSLMDEFQTFTVLDSESITGWDSANLAFDPGKSGVGMVASWAEDGSVYVKLGNSNSVPEPSTWALLILGIAGLAWFRRRK